MRKIIQDKNFFVFRDTDGVPGFTIRSYDGEPDDARFLFDGGKQVFLMRHAGQIILLDGLSDEVVSVLTKVSKVRFFETPEDSSEIVRQYEIGITRIENVPLSPKQIVPEKALSNSENQVR